MPGILEDTVTCWILHSFNRYALSLWINFFLLRSKHSNVEKKFFFKLGRRNHLFSNNNILNQHG